ncbi:hypothetical protein SAMN02745150_00280 [Brevinema andersonii]|uniref:Uncharacterized protein n=1 Tax=Brevinema andersonii TaxID=34097 RepID=A0A1I1D406_BREAD|nr:hypothetical protein [Brevinema andersonii]SFB69527.1 hypothetical protein SAMN02745150_00280 [Brevinema andersonii]
MRWFVWLMLPTVAFGNDYLWSAKELEMLEGAYKRYIDEVRKNPSAADAYLAEQKPFAESFPMPGSRTVRSIPELRLFSLPVPHSFSPEDVNERISLAHKDLGTLKAFNVITRLLAEFYTSSNENQKYRYLYRKGEEYMLSLAKKAAKKSIPRGVREELSAGYAMIASELSEIDFPAPYRAYHLRRAYLLDSPEQAADEIRRLEESLKN